MSNMSHSDIISYINIIKSNIERYKNTPNLYSTKLENESYIIIKKQYNAVTHMIMQYVIENNKDLLINIYQDFEYIQNFITYFDNIIQSRNIEFKYRIHQIIDELKQNNNCTNGMREKLDTVDIYGELQF